MMMAMYCMMWSRTVLDSRQSALLANCGTPDAESGGVLSADPGWLAGSVRTRTSVCQACAPPSLDDSPALAHARNRINV